LSYAADKQTDSKILPTPTDIVDVDNKRYKTELEDGQEEAANKNVFKCFLK